MDSAGDYLAASHAGLVPATSTPDYGNAPAEPRQPACDLSCPVCGSAFEVDCGCNLRGYDPENAVVGFERLVAK